MERITADVVLFKGLSKNFGFRIALLIYYTHWLCAAGAVYIIVEDTAAYCCNTFYDEYTKIPPTDNSLLFSA